MVGNTLDPADVARTGKLVYDTSFPSVLVKPGCAWKPGAESEDSRCGEVTT